MPEAARGPRQGPGRPPGLFAQFFSLSVNWAMVALAAGVVVLDWAAAGGKILLYGDATAHLMMARRMVDSMTPGLSQWGTVWLPLPHLLDAILIDVPGFWRTGMAGALVSLASLVMAAWFLHRFLKREFGAVAAGWAAAFFCLNPGLLYLAVTPMDEAVYLAALLGLVDRCSRYARMSARRAERGLPAPFAVAWAAGAFALAAAMIRYDGWFVMPFALAVLAVAAASWSEAWGAAWRFALVSGAGPAAWLLYNWFYYDDPLEFARGKYSAHRIYLAALRRGGQRYPGDHALATAFRYFAKTVALDCGTLLLVLALAGAAVLLCRAAWRWRGGRPLPQPVKAGNSLAIGLLALPLPWYLWAMWSGNVPIFLPAYWPHSYYNVRYGLQLLPAAATFSGIAVAGLAGWLGRRAGERGARVRAATVLILALVCGGVYLAMLAEPGPAVYAEAVRNAPARLRMEHELASALADRRPGDRVLMYVGDYPGALADDAIPLRQVVQESNLLLWQNALGAPQRYADWVVIEQHTEVDKLVNRAAMRRYFQPVASISVTSQPQITVYRRIGAGGPHP